MTISKMRASIVAMGPLWLALVMHAGGCATGLVLSTSIQRFWSFGAYHCSRLCWRRPIVSGCAMVYLDFLSVCLKILWWRAVRAEGTTILENVAREPEIVDLQLLNRMGADICAGTETIKIHGALQAPPMMIPTELKQVPLWWQLPLPKAMSCWRGCVRTQHAIDYKYEMGVVFHEYQMTAGYWVRPGNRQIVKTYHPFQIRYAGYQSSIAQLLAEGSSSWTETV